MIRKLARDLRRNQTDAERKLWHFLHDRQFGDKFRRQHPIGSYIADFCCIEKQLIIELDGGQHAERQVQDKQRTEKLSQRGFKMLRFWNNDVLNRTESVLEAIRQALEDPHLSPLPERERES